MANFLDYLAWRGDLTFAERSLNEVDNLIFSQLAYLEMKGAAPGFGEGALPLSEVVRRCGALGYQESDLVNNPWPLAERAAACARYRDVRISCYESEFDAQRQIQFAAMAFSVADLVYVAFRGTDMSLVGWREDFNASYLEQTPGQRAAVRYLDRAADCFSGALRIGGHSKGGNLAVYAAAFCKPAVRERIAQVYSNDGPGMNRQVLCKPEIEAVWGKVRRYMPAASRVGILLESRGERVLIRSSEQGAMQHNPYTWLVEGTGFVRASAQSGDSLFMDETLRRWLEEVEEEQREDFVNALFDTLEATGAVRFPELGEKPWNAAGAILQAFGAMPADRQRSLMDTVKKLIGAGRSVIAEEAKSLLDQLPRPKIKKASAEAEGNGAPNEKQTR